MYERFIFNMSVFQPRRVGSFSGGRAADLHGGPHICLYGAPLYKV